MIKLTYYFLVVCIGTACGTSPKLSGAGNTPSKKRNASPAVVDTGFTVYARFAPPTGYNRTEVPENSFASYLRHFPLLDADAPVYLYNGKLKGRQDVHAAVLDIDVGDKDLQQCADAIMRLRAEYLYREKKYDDIRFNFTNGFTASYAKWRQGYRIQVNGNQVTWAKTASASDSYSEFKKYLWRVFTYAGTMSLSKELQAQQVKNISIGDVFIKGGSPGHAVIVMDVAENAKGEKCFLLAQSYMPAQQVHILKNPSGGTWYFDDFGDVLDTPEWTFTKEQLMKF